MKHSKKQKFRLQIAGLVCSQAIYACGRVGPDFLEAPKKLDTSVRLAGDSRDSRSVSTVPGSYIVMFRTERTQDNLFFSSFADEFSHHYMTLSESYLSDSRIKSLDVLTTVDFNGLESSHWQPEFTGPKSLAPLSGLLDANVGAGVIARIDFANRDVAKDVLKEWEVAGRIWYAEPNEISHISDGDLATYSTSYTKLQSWHRTIKLPEAFGSLAGGKVAGANSESDILSSVPIVAVLDSGVDYEHPQLKDNIWVNSAVGSAGCSDDLHGCNTTASSKGSLGNGEVWPVVATGPGVSCVTDETKDKCDHGTHVAGIIAAKPDSGKQVAGVCPFCKIMILRVGEVEAGDTSGDPQIRDDSQIRAFKYLARFRKSGGSAVRIVNASFGKYSRSRSLSILIDVLKKSGSGTLVIGAASNEDSMIRAYPAALSNAIAVSSIGTASDNSSVQKSPFSNYGPWVDIAAPGYNVISTVSGGSTGPKSGTSMATPVVAGCAGLLLAAFPNLGFDELRQRILNTANASLLYGTDTDGGKINNQYYYTKISGETERRPLLGGGVVDINAMITNAKNSATGQPLDRVTAGCGAIGREIDESAQLPIAWLFVLILPLGVEFVSRRVRYG
jgi:Subtilase family